MKRLTPTQRAAVDAVIPASFWESHVLRSEIRFRSFAEARDFVRSLGLRGQSEWNKWSSSGKRPADIPAGPSRTYAEDWSSWGDWLGTNHVTNQNREFRPFGEARDFVRSLGLKTKDEWNAWSKNRPPDIPSTPPEVYAEHWKSWGDWLGKGERDSKNRQFRAFAEAREFVRGLRLQNQSEWNTWFKSEHRPLDIPTDPRRIYIEHWTNWSDWLGSDERRGKNRKFRPFTEARDLIRSLGLKNSAAWRAWCKSDQRPLDIPAGPARVYDEWAGWGDWLGTNRVANQNRQFRAFAEARDFARGLNLKGRDEWVAWCKLEQRPTDIPTDPRAAYESGWAGWADWLGSDERYSSKNRTFRPFAEARDFVRSIGLKTHREWKTWYMSGSRPLDIPTDPRRIYAEHWTNWSDWLEAGNARGKQRRRKQ